MRGQRGINIIIIIIFSSTDLQGGDDIHLILRRIKEIRVYEPAYFNVLLLEAIFFKPCRFKLHVYSIDVRHCVFRQTSLLGRHVNATHDGTHAVSYDSVG